MAISPVSLPSLPYPTSFQWLSVRSRSRSPPSPHFSLSHSLARRRMLPFSVTHTHTRFFCRQEIRQRCRFAGIAKPRRGFSPRDHSVSRLGEIKVSGGYLSVLIRDESWSPTRGFLHLMEQAGRSSNAGKSHPRIQMRSACPGSALIVARVNFAIFYQPTLPVTFAE